MAGEILGPSVLEKELVTRLKLEMLLWGCPSVNMLALMEAEKAKILC